MHNFRFRKFILVFILLIIPVFVFSGHFFPKSALAKYYSGGEFNTDPSLGHGLDFVGITVKAPGTDKGILAQTKNMVLGFLKDLKNAKWEWAQKIFAATSWKKAASAYLNRIAYESAIYIATGDKGQAPMFDVDSPMDLAFNAADNFAGYYIESIGKDTKIFKDLNLCEPNPNLRINIGLGLLNDVKGSAPNCTFTEMKNNWAELARNPNFLNDFQDWFDPSSNDLGIALTMHSNLSREMDRKSNDEITRVLRDQGWKAKKDPLSGKTITPASLISDWIKDKMGQSDDVELTYTGSAAADAIGVFTSTLAGKLLEEWLKKGLISNPKGVKGYDWNKLSDYYADYSESGGITATKERYLSLTENNFNVRGGYDVVSELVQCPNPDKPGPTNCVIWNDGFKNAITGDGNTEGYYTVGQAMKAGLLKEDGIFGFKSKGLEPLYSDDNSSFSYRTMIILRKFRILPVGWELAAQYINDNFDDVGQRSLGDMVACYDKNDEFNGYTNPWCEGLVDPGWLIKAPQNFCKREGPGPEIVSESTNSGEYSILRNDKYCADEQTCIQEDPNGNCEAYGYCTEERRVWNFKAKTCDPVFNTCETFSRAKGEKEGEAISYLKNTLDFGECNGDNAGCKAYCEDYNLAGNFTCDLNHGNKLFLDYGADESAKCDSSEEGCHEFIRPKRNTGVNLITNSSFEDFTGTIDSGMSTFKAWDGISAEASSDSFIGEVALKMNTNIERIIDLGPPGYDVSGEALNLSFDAKNCSEGDYFEIVDNYVGPERFIASSSIMASNQWFRNSLSFAIPDSISGYQIKIRVVSNSCMLDAFQLERGDKASAYSDYREHGLIYEKLAPSYLGCDGNNDPEECNNFARECNLNELGCELYTSKKDGITLPAKTDMEDYCPKECDGYDEFLQLETSFDSLQSQYFIPKISGKCSAQAVGCDEFTNLDKIGEGAEAREYYSNLKHCIKPDENQCAEFYLWEGSAEAGYQLKVFSLKLDDDSDDIALPPNFRYNGDPHVVEADFNECSQDIYNLPATDPAYNPDCREFYNRDGEISYHLFSRVVTCADNCHPYRRLEDNKVEHSVCIDECSGDLDCVSANCTNTNCDDADGLRSCRVDDDYSIFCKGGGIWNTSQGACIYMAIPGEGRVCSASEAGCREYSGNTGSNEQIILNNAFENGTNEGWEGDLSPAPGNESLFSGEHSLEITGMSSIARINLGSALRKNKSYALEFLAKANGAGTNSLTDIKIGSSTSAGNNYVDFDFESSEVALSEDWQIYKLNISVLNYNYDLDGDFEIIPGTELYIEADGDFYLDNVRLIMLQDRYYLKRGELNVPESCFYDVYGEYDGPDLNLRCEAYSDRDNEISYLRKFSEFCKDSAVGCELMIDTHNYDDYETKTWNGGTASLDDDEVVDADEYKYIVYDQDKLCNSSDQGCELLGRPTKYGNEVIYTKAYYTNDPDKYEEILCNEEKEDCDSWLSTEGESYFKDPGFTLCEWKKAAYNGTSEWKWFRKRMKFCDVNGDRQKDSDENICVNDDNCGEGTKCVLNENDDPCDVNDFNSLKTIGLGGGEMIEQPVPDSDGINWVGLCPAKQSGCTEYIDPISKYNINQISNGDFSQGGSGVDADGWGSGRQGVDLEKNTLYVLALENNNTIHLNSFKDSSNAAVHVKRLLGNNSFDNTLISSIDINSPSGERHSVLFFTPKDIKKASLGATEYSTGNSSKIELKKALVTYRIKDDINEGDCNGLVDPNEGCVLVNERGVDSVVNNSIDYSTLIYDANVNIIDSSNHTKNQGNGNSANSNRLIKGFPDRYCNEWLACKSYGEDTANNEKVCYDIGACNRLDEQGRCGNFIEKEKENQDYNNTGSAIDKADIYNMSGYVNTAYYEASSAFKSHYPLGSIEQVGQTAMVPNGSFELYGSNLYPLGWHPGWTKSDPSMAWDENKFSVINSPLQAQNEGIKYPMEGKSFLKFSTTAGTVLSDFIDVEPNTEYILSFYLNTINFHVGDGFQSILAGISLETYNATGTLVNSAGIAANNEAFGHNDFIDDGCKTCAYWPGYNFNGIGIYGEAGKDWTLYKLGFKVGEKTKKIKLSMDGKAWSGNDTCPSGVPTNPSVGCYEADGTEATACDGNLSSGHLKTSDTCTGNVYIDDIKLMPVLDARKVPRDQGPYVAQDQTIAQTCRLYPENDSLSCSYLEDSGVKKKGWPGYCLEHDRYPGNPDACLMWYPIDRVNGDGIEEGAGYLDRFPLYYTLDTEKIWRPAVKGHWEGDGCLDDDLCGYVGESCGELKRYKRGCCVVAGGEAIYEFDKDVYAFSSTSLSFGTDIRFDDYHSEVSVAQTKDGPWTEILDIPAGTAASLYPNGFYIDISTFGLTKIRYLKIHNDVGESDHCHGGGAFSEVVAYSKFLAATKVAQVVTPMGNNKFWSGRAYQGSDYELACNSGLVGTSYVSCDYLTDYKPFGAIVPPAKTWSELANPYEWSGDSDLDIVGNFPLYYEEADKTLDQPYQVRMGQAYKKNDLKRLFAQSYGVWQWNGSNYVEVNDGWSPPDCDCGNHGDFTSRAKSINDYCGIRPQIDNIKLDGSPNSIDIKRTRFVNLTFNTKINNQQLPLRSIEIGWGDGATTSISGIEMRDRFNEEEPHSFYHLYSVYDCPDSSSGCERTPIIKVRDNWGWENNNSPYNQCNETCRTAIPLDPDKVNFAMTYTDLSKNPDIYVLIFFEGNKMYAYGSQNPVGEEYSGPFDAVNFFGLSPYAVADYNNVVLSGSTPNGDLNGDKISDSIVAWFASPSEDKFYFTSLRYGSTTWEWMDILGTCHNNCDQKCTDDATQCGSVLTACKSSCTDNLSLIGFNAAEAGIDDVHALKAWIGDDFGTTDVGYACGGFFDPNYVYIWCDYNRTGLLPLQSTWSKQALFGDDGLFKDEDNAPQNLNKIKASWHNDKNGDSYFMDSEYIYTVTDLNLAHRDGDGNYAATFSWAPKIRLEDVFPNQGGYTCLDASTGATQETQVYVCNPDLNDPCSVDNRMSGPF